MSAGWQLPGHPPAPLLSSCSSLQGPADSTGSPGPGGLARCPAWWLPGFPECPVPRDAGGRAWAWAPHPRTERVPIARDCGPGLPLSGDQGPWKEDRQAQSLMFFLFSFQIIGISLSQFNIWSFLFKRKGKGLCVVWVCFRRLCFRSRVLPQACGPVAVPWQGLRLSSAPVSLCLQPLSCFISIFIFVLLLS